MVQWKEREVGPMLDCKLEPLQHLMKKSRSRNQIISSRKGYHMNPWVSAQKMCDRIIIF